MYKNQLQELAQRSCFNLPSYACMREGPDHAPRFKATVNFNGEIFASPGYFSTLRQAEHAAAEVALNTLSKRGPAQSLAAKILDETGVCKNLLQETAQRAGVSLPTYTTVRSGPGHLPVFTCTVEVAGMQFSGDAAKTKKQAEKNAAMTAWSALKTYASQSQITAFAELEVNDEQEQNTIARALATANGKDGCAHGGLSTTSSVRLTQIPLLQRSPSRSGLEDMVLHRPAPAPALAYIPHHVNPTWASADRREHSTRFGQDGLQGGRYSRPLLGEGLDPDQQPVQSPGGHPMGQPVYRHTNIPIKPGMAYQPRPRQPHQLLSTEVNVRPPMAYQPRSRQPPAAGVIGSGMPVPGVSGHSTPTASRSSMDEHQADEEAWLRGEPLKEVVPISGRSQELGKAGSDMLWSGSRQYWSGMGARGMNSMRSATGGQSMALAAPVNVRTLIPVHAAPRRHRDEEDDDTSDSTTEGEVRTRQVLSQLSL